MNHIPMNHAYFCVGALLGILLVSYLIRRLVSKFLPNYGEYADLILPAAALASGVCVIAYALLHIPS